MKKYRITGPQSISRLEPLLRQHIWTNELSEQAVAVERYENEPLDFVWETTCEREWRKSHASSCVFNKLHNTQILENKANLAFLQKKMSCPSLKTVVATSSSEVASWLANYFSESLNSTIFIDRSQPIELDWWTIKASKGNGGRDIWFANRHNFAEVVQELPKNDEFVIQRYVDNPMLWQGKKKFHFRCYTLLRADMSALLYERAYVLTAGNDYCTSSTDPHSHITNLSVNKKFENHPGPMCLFV